MHIKQKKNLLTLLALLSFLSVFWVMSANNTFSFDDTTLLKNASMSSFGELFHFFPQSIYLDRPMRDVLLKVMYELFGTDYVFYHIALVLTHLFNVFLVYKVFLTVIGTKYGEESDTAFIGAIVTAGFFGIWPQSHMAVQWISGNNDLMGVTFALLSMSFFLKYRVDERHKRLSFFLLLVFYYLALRTKEMFYLLPFLFLFYEIYQMTLNKKRARLSLGTSISVCVMAAFLGAMVYLKLQDTTFTYDSSNPYYQTFNPLTLCWNLLRYCEMCFDVSNPGFMYHSSVAGKIGAVVMLLGLATALFVAISKKEFGPLLCYFSIGVVIAPVLPIVNQCHALYLYFPSIFVGAVIACGVISLKRNQMRASVIILIGCIIPAYVGGYTSLKASWLSTAMMENKAWRDIKEIERPILNSTIYVRLPDIDTYTPFYYGPGSVCNLIYQDMSLTTILLDGDEAVEFTVPYVLWEYGEDGHVREIAHDYGANLQIASVYPAEIQVSAADIESNTELQFGITPNMMLSDLKIRIDGEELIVFRGEDFISTLIPASSLADKDSITVEITNATGSERDQWCVNIIQPN